MYEKVAEYFSIMSRTELYTCSASQFSFGKIKEQAQTVCSSYLLYYFTNIYQINYVNGESNFRRRIYRSVATTIWPVS